MKKFLSAILCSLVLVCWASGAMASIMMDYAFTSDNYITSFSLIETGSNTVVLSGSKQSAWTSALTNPSSVALAAGTSYQWIWNVQNGNTFGNPSSSTLPVNGDPMAFLGQFSVDGLVYLSSTESTIWKVNNVDPATYGLLSNPSTIWYSTLNGYNSLKGSIDDAAQWIGSGLAGVGTMTVTANFSTAPVPIPGAAILLGSGLLGLVGLRRRQLV